jgi:hypothetical protein
VVRSAVTIKILETKQQIEKMKDHVATLKRAKELLETYEYDPEVAAPPAMGSFIGFGP